MTAPLPPALDAETNRTMAAGLYNFCWPLMAKADRTPEETDLLIHAAHASRWHWQQAGVAVNRARGEWLCSRVYAVLGRAEPALWHARRCLELVEAGGESFEDWDRAAALEAMARALATAGMRDEAEHYRSLTAAELSGIAEDDDRDVIEKDLASIPL